MSVTLRELMVKAVVLAAPEDTLGEVRRKMSSLRIGAVPVVDAAGILVGILTTDDLVTEYPATIPVSRVMTTPVQTLSPEADSLEAARLMREHTYHHIVVTEGDAVSGLVSSLDLLALLEEAPADPD